MKTENLAVDPAEKLKRVDVRKKRIEEIGAEIFALPRVKLLAAYKILQG
jgi:hypothetical protein